MKNFLLTLFLSFASFAMAQFSSGTVTLGSTGMTVKLDTNPTTATLTLSGDSNSYLGIGSGSGFQGMQNGADGFIYNANSTTNTNLDYTFGGVGITPSPDPQQDWTITSNTVSGSTRTIIATRTLAGGPGDTLFTNAAGSIPIFYAKGGTTTLAYHGSTNRGYATLNMSGSLSTNNLSLNRNFANIYPNPVGDVLYFSNPEKVILVKIYDASGKNIKVSKLEGNGLIVSDLMPGTYYVEMINKDNKSTYEKLLKK